MKFIKSWLVLLMVLFPITIAFGQSLQMAGHDQWLATSQEGKVAYVQGIMVGAYYVAIAYMDQNQGKGLPRIDHLVPIGIDGGSLATLIDRVYQDRENRNLPIVYIVVEWKKFNAIYGVVPL